MTIYLYEAVVDQPKETDDSKFDGAARLDVRFENGQFNSLESIGQIEVGKEICKQQEKLACKRVSNIF